MPAPWMFSGVSLVSLHQADHQQLFGFFCVHQLFWVVPLSPVQRLLNNQYNTKKSASEWLKLQTPPQIAK